MIDLFHSKTHIDYLKRRLEGESSVRGTKTRLAEFLRVRPAFLSQVLAQKYSLSLEQADLANQFFDHSSEESEFFLLLVSRDRAATTSLKMHFEKQIEAVRHLRLQVVQRLGKRTDISDEAKGIYYSSWLYAAIHVACTIPGLRTRRVLAEQLHIPIETAERILHFLESSQMLKKEGDAYVPTNTWLRLSKDSPHIIKHHSNWRQKAIQNFEVQTDEDLHYSGVFSLDRKTALRIKDQFLEFIKSQVQEIETAKEEDLYVFGADFFKLIK